MNYYTPSIDEFFVGFEYEEYTAGYTYDVKLLDEGVTGHQMTLQILTDPKGTMEWVKRTYELEDFIAVIDGEVSTFIPEVKVKFLDFEDIKELGWNFTHTFSNISNDKLYEIHFELVQDVVKYQMLVSNELHVVISGWYHEDIYNPVTRTLFRGKLRNKSELKKLMKQLGIQ